MDGIKNVFEGLCVDLWNEFIWNFNLCLIMIIEVKELIEVDSECVMMIIGVKNWEVVFDVFDCIMVFEWGMV